MMATQCMPAVCEGVMSPQVWRQGHWLALEPARMAGLLIWIMEGSAYLHTRTVLRSCFDVKLVHSAAGEGDGLAGVRACARAALAGSGHSRLA